MENEELLQSIGQMISENNHNMSSMIDGKLKPISDRLTSIESAVANLGERTSGIEVTLENDISKNLQLLTEGHSENVDKLQTLEIIEKIVEETSNKVDVMFKVIQEHSGDIKELKLAK
ncbi:hypothetical protein [Caproiciproducens sp.]|uniref:hypothetical protein n=1 Tax=Caproiciproducens sp. TaxID=1954376 RepID=UPI00289B3398|nr:hypothetical protein [Caproiciproducens sp.]